MDVSCQSHRDQAGINCVLFWDGDTMLPNFFNSLPWHSSAGCPSPHPMGCLCLAFADSKMLSGVLIQVCPAGLLAGEGDSPQTLQQQPGSQALLL